jgi:hypothetical protein
MVINRLCLEKILNFGVVLPHTVYNLYKIILLF